MLPLVLFQFQVDPAERGASGGRTYNGGFDDDAFALE